MSATSAIRPSSRKRSACFSPSPSMSIAPLLTKCLTCWKDWPGQPARLGQIVKTASSGLTVGVPQAGHFFGGFGLARALLAALDQRRDDLGDHVAGPHHHDLVADPDVLARQVLLVVEGRGGDGDAADVDRLEHRERAPGGRCGRRSRRRRAASSSPSSAANFQAIAQRGSRPTTPSSRHSARSSTLTTTPSIS